MWNCGLSTGQSMVSRAACMMNRNRAGPSQAPCLTPMLLGTLVSVLPTLNFMLAPVCNRITMLMKCSGSPNFLRISHSAVRLTVSNAFTRSTKSVGGEVVLLALAECNNYAEAAINGAALSLASEAGLLLELSSPSFSWTKFRRATITHESIFDAMSNKQIALQFLHCARSPFFGRSFMRATRHSS